MTIIVAETPYRESLLTGPPAASPFARPTQPVTAMLEVASPQTFSLLWQREPPKNCNRALPTRGHGTVAPCSSSTVRPSRCRTRPESVDVPSAAKTSAWPGLSARPDRCAAILATGACHDLEIAAYQGKGTGEKSLFDKCTTRSNLATSLSPTLYSTITSSRATCADGASTSLVAFNTSVQEVGSRRAARRRHPCLAASPEAARNDPTAVPELPKTLVMRQVPVDARDKNNRVKQFNVVTTILDSAIDGQQIGNLYERRWKGEVDIRSIKCTMQMDVLRCKTPDMVHKEIWTHLLAYNLLRTVMAVAANDIDVEPRKISFKGAKQTLTAFAPKIEAARPENRASLIDAMLTTIAYHRVGDRPGRWEPRARKRRPKWSTPLKQPRQIAKLPHNRSKWF